MRIQGVYTHNMRNDAHFQFHTEVKDLVEKSNPEALKIKPLFDNYLVFYQREDEALKKINKSALTKKIHDADKARDILWYGLVETNNVGLKHFSPEVQEKSEKLKIVFDTYGNVAKKRMNEQTSALYNILQDFEGKYAEDIAVAGLSRWVAELKDRNIAFSNLMKQRFEESAARTDIVMKDARGDLNAAYMAIKNRINALVEVEGAEDYETFVKTLNVIIAKHMQLNARPRKLTKKDGQEEQTVQEEQAIE